MAGTDFVSKGQALVAQGQYQEAVKVCRLGLLGRPTTVDGRIVLGQALLALKRFDEVLAEMRVALDLDPTSLPAQMLKGEALIEKGDGQAALEVLTKVKQQRPMDVKVGELLARAVKIGGRNAGPVSPAVGFVGGGGSMPASLPPDDEPTSSDSGTYTGETNVSPGKRGRHDDDDDFGAPVAPPRGAVMKSAGGGRTRLPRDEDSSLDIEPSDLIEVDETNDVQKVDRDAIRDSINRPSGPLDDFPLPARPKGPTLPPPASALPPPTSALPRPKGMSVPPPLAGPSLATTQAALPPPAPGGPRLPLPGVGPGPGVHPNAPTVVPLAPASSMRSTLIAPPPPVPPPLSPQAAASAAVDSLFKAEPPPPAPLSAAPVWAKATMVAGAGQTAGADDPTKPPSPLDPRVAAPAAPASAAPAAGVVVDPAMAAEAAALAADAQDRRPRRRRRKLSIVLWTLLGTAVIGGGVFAGFQIRAMRLGKQIGAARTQAVDLAKSDTWRGWSGARDRLAGIAQASATIDNRAALLRARAVLAYEFGDGLAEAQGVLSRLSGKGGADTAIAAAYVALAVGEPKAARAAVDAAVAAAPGDATAQYLAGLAAGLEGDDAKAVSELDAAYKKEDRPIFTVALARAYARQNAWPDAIGAVDRALAAYPDHPAALIEKALILARAGMIARGTSQATDAKVMLQKVIAEGAEPFAQQTRGVAPAQVALANVALANVELALGDAKGAQAALEAAAKVGSDDQRFAEEATDVLLRMGNLDAAAAAAERLIKAYPASVAGLITQAQIAVARQKPNEALDIFTKHPDLAQRAAGLAIRAHAKVAVGDTAGAKADYDAALKKAPSNEVALVGRAWIQVAEGDLKAARNALEPAFNPNTASAALSVAYAATLRRSQDAGDRDKAKAILEKVVAGPPVLDAARAHAELGRLAREAGDPAAARTSLAAAVAAGYADARLELAEVQLEERDPQGGRETLEQMLAAAPDPAPPHLLLAAARARALVGDHSGAAKLLDLADKSPSVVRWQADRERGRLALRRGDLKAAGELLGKALDKSDVDRETLLIAADAGATDPKELAALVGKVRAVAADRFRGQAEEKIVAGKLALAAEQPKEAYAAYNEASALLAGKASSARLAQVHFGLAVTAYLLDEEAEASKQLEVALKEDPTLYAAYLFAAAIAESQPKTAFALAEKAVQFNPEYIDGWITYGQLAKRLKKKAELAKAVQALTAIAPNSESLAELK